MTMKCGGQFHSQACDFQKDKLAADLEGNSRTV